MLTDAMFETRDQIAELVPSSEPVEVGGAIFAEKRWREPKDGPSATTAGSEIALSRWTAASGKERMECATTPDHCHVVALALGAASMRLWTQSKLLFEGSVAPGTILVSAPGQQLRARVTPPFDFLHLHVGNRFLREEGLAPDEDGIAAQHEPAPFRDTLAEALGRSLLDENLHRSQPEYARVVAKAIVMRAIGRPPAKRHCLALPKWRMKRLEHCLAASIDRPIRLDDMAAAAGLSKMHFAAQFRAATGFRPHEYLLFKRIERAKAVLATTEMPLVQVAFSVGFVAQAHFSTVFKRFTGKSPARWKQECQREAWPATATRLNIKLRANTQ
jgi:AraC family transcriptional regulator